MAALRTQSRRRFLATASLALLALPVMGCESGATAADGQATTPARSPAEILAEGRKLAFNGQWEEAATSFGSLLSEPGDTGLIARYELARMHDLLGRPQEAAAVLEGMLAQPPILEPVVRAWFLYAAVQAALGNHEAAARSYGRYVELGGPAAPYARVEQARALGNSGDSGDAALAALGPLLEGAGSSHVRRQALRLAGTIEEAAGRLAAALGHYNALLAIAPWQSERVFALTRIADMHERLGNTPAAAEALRQIVTRYPHTPEAELALGKMAALGHPADALSAGIVHYRRRNNQQARDLFNAYLRANGSRGPGAAQALFYLGALAERRDDVRLALENYQEAYDADPTGNLAVEALWERASVLDGAGRADEAIAAYSLVAERFPTSTRAGDAGFRAGYMAYLLGRTAQARHLWSAAMGTADAASAARAAFWAGRAAHDQGDIVSARLAWTQAVQRNPTGYYGLRAAAVLAGQPQAPQTSRATAHLPTPDWAAAEAWLTAWAGAEPPNAGQAMHEAEDWRSGVELLHIGWQKTGLDAVELAINARAREPWVLYRMARAMFELGQPHLSELAGVHLLNLTPGTAWPLPPAIAALAYPAPWADLVQFFSDEYGVDPLLLYALMRQESAFNPTAGSSAGAFGLTQVIPPTAQEIARALGKEPFAFQDLARPINAVQFGAFYIGTQVRNFKGNIYHALAAYNGGPGNASRWARLAGTEDVDRFYETVDFAETKLYLRLVLQNYAWYRHLYGGAPRPALHTGGQ